MFVYVRMAEVRRVIPQFIYLSVKSFIGEEVMETA